MQLSLQTKLNELQQCDSDFQMKRNPELHKFIGEGRRTYKNQRIEYESDYVSFRGKPELNELLKKQGLEFSMPQDIAWCPSENIVLAHANSDHPPFEFISARLQKGKVVPLDDRLAVSD